jgi:hypothetical protein
MGGCRILLTENTKTRSVLITSDCDYHYGRMNYKKASESGSSLCTNVPLICPVCSIDSPNRTFWKYNLLYHMSIFHLDENGFLPRPFPQSLLVSTHITKVEELNLGVGEDETNDWRESNMIPNTDNLQANDIEELESQFEGSQLERKRAASEVSSTSNTSVRGQPPALKVRRTDA